MTILEIAKKRSSVRSYKSTSIEKEKLDKILEAAHVAPTAANFQPVRLLVVQNKENLSHKRDRFFVIRASISTGDCRSCQTAEAFQGR